MIRILGFVCNWNILSRYPRFSLAHSNCKQTLPSLVCIFIVCFFSAKSFAKIDETGVKVKWRYVGNEGPTRWGQLNPAFALCANGKQQSPINISSKYTMQPQVLTIEYHPAPMLVMDNGATLLTMGNAQIMINDGQSVQLNFASNSRESINVGAKDYRLVQFHIHTPSEHLWHGRAFPMEIHFVHQGDHGEVRVMAVFITAGAENNTLQKIINHLPQRNGVQYIIPGEQINPADLLPRKHDFYSYAGSLTTPPCWEGVQWMILSEPMTASPAQILKLRQAANGENARPVQSLQGRQIFFSPT